MMSVQEGNGDSKDQHVEGGDDDDFSMSSYDGEQTDSLIIKPPQAVTLHKDKRDKKDKRERLKHKGSKHKDKSRHRDRGLEREDKERRREHRRMRGSDRRESKHSSRKDRGSKHERMMVEGMRKMDKERKLLDRDSDRRKHREGDDYLDGRDDMYDRYYPMRGHGASHMHHHREKKRDERGYMAQGLMQLHISPPREKSEREKRMEKFMVAERQKEITQKEADARRMKREERKEEFRMVELRQRAEASMKRHASSKASDYRRKKGSSTHEPETVELISDEEDFKSVEEENVNERDHRHSKKKKKKRSENEVEDEPKMEVEEEPKMEPTKESNKVEGTSPLSSSSEIGSESESSSSSSSEEEGEASGHSENEDKNEPDDIATNDKENESSMDSSSGDTTDDERKGNSEDEGSGKDGDDNYLDDSPIPSSPELKETLPTYFPAIMGCRSVDEFECLNRIEEGTYGVVYRAREKTTNEIVALKRLKMEKEKEGFPITSLREVNTLLKGQHENIVTVREIVVGSNMDKIYIVMDYVEHDLKSLMETMKKKNQSFTIGELKTLMIQLLRAVRHLHDNWILHRDLKTSNLLLSHRGILKVGDFGLAREYGSPLKQYTPIVVTLWYRAPELLLGTKEYSCPIDVWSCGCIFGELLGMDPMFPGKSEIDQLNKIFKDLGTPSDKIWPGYSEMPVTKKTQFAFYPYNHLKERYKTRLSEEGFKLFNGFLTYNPSKRITASEVLEHDYFHCEDPAPISPSMFPTWPAKSENAPGAAKGRKVDSPKPPSGGKNFKDLGDGEDENIAGFFLGSAPNSGPGFTLKF